MRASSPPSPLEAQALDRVRAKLQQISRKEVLLQSETDPGLIAGLVIELEGRTYDGSVRAYLEALTDRIEHGN
jgi:F0F1-type ATP synthase delta subunit